MRPLALLLVLGTAHAAKLDYLEAKKTAAPGRTNDARVKRLVGKPPAPLVNLKNIWTGEVLALDRNKDGAVPAETFSRFLRCHFTDEATSMDPRLQGVLLTAAMRFQADRIEIVSGYRAPKFNLMLRKKGHEVARDSQHTYGHAVDFRVAGVSTRTLEAWVRSLGLGGVGFYPESAFVHADTGPIRTWAGR
jgi:uncharacterized protein YcbK (DUF882 family)